VTTPQLARPATVLLASFIAVLLPPCDLVSCAEAPGPSC